MKYRGHLAQLDGDLFLTDGGSRRCWSSKRASTFQCSLPATSFRSPPRRRDPERLPGRRV